MKENRNLKKSLNNIPLNDNYDYSVDRYSNTKIIEHYLELYDYLEKSTNNFQTESHKNAYDRFYSVCGKVGKLVYQNYLTWHRNIQIRKILK